MIPSSITNRKLLIVEGKDEANLCLAFFRKLEIPDVGIIVLESKDNFKNGIDALRNIPGFPLVEIVAFIRDAEEQEPSSAFDSITHSLGRNGLPIPPRIGEFSNTNPQIGIFIMPGNGERGMIETLCLKSLAGNRILTCIEEYFTCSGGRPGNEEKSKVLAYLSIKDGIVYSLGVAALCGYWDLDHPCFVEFKGFLTHFT